MNILPDVNILLAFGWSSHADHLKCREWFSNQERFSTCAITELGFLRVSMSPAYRASHEDASHVLQSLTSRKIATFLSHDLPTAQMAAVSSYKDITDCYLVELARKHSCKLATLDEALIRAPWAEGIAYHPFRS